MISFYTANEDEVEGDNDMNEHGLDFGQPLGELEQAEAKGSLNKAEAVSRKTETIKKSSNRSTSLGVLDGGSSK